MIHIDLRTPVQVSVIVPVTERPEPLAELYEEYSTPLGEAVGPVFEFVFVSDPWFEDMVESLRPLAERGAPIRVLKAGQAMGETSLVRFAAERCRGETLLILPAYRRVEASALPALLVELERDGDVVVARRWPRRDGLINRLQTRCFNALTARLAGDRVHDLGCGVRALKRATLLELPLYGDFIRYLPVFAFREGYRVKELPAPQHSRDLTPRIYAPGVYLRRLIDVLGLFFLIRFTEKPLRFFGLVGFLLLAPGAVILGLVGIQRILGQGIADRPLLLLGVLLLVLGVQAVALGLIGEIIVHLQLHAAGRRRYRIQGAA